MVISFDLNRVVGMFFLVKQIYFCNFVYYMKQNKYWCLFLFNLNKKKLIQKLEQTNE